MKHLLIIPLLFTVVALAAQVSDPRKDTQTNLSKKMTVEIWSDVMCPFCYIGKRKFEQALAQFEGRDSVEVIWRSFQLDPSLKTDTTQTVAQSLSEKKGWSKEETDKMTQYVTDMAKQVGLEYHFEKAVVANSYDAHRFTHFAKTKGKQIEAEEQLFAAYFTEGKNTADHATLAQLGAAIGLDEKEVLEVLASKAHSSDVDEDIYTARQFGINSVPFFVFNRKKSRLRRSRPTGVFESDEGGVMSYESGVMSYELARRRVFFFSPLRL